MVSRRRFAVALTCLLATVPPMVVLVHQGWVERLVADEEAELLAERAAYEAGLLPERAPDEAAQRRPAAAGRPAATAASARGPSAASEPPASAEPPAAAPGSAGAGAAETGSSPSPRGAARASSRRGLSGGRCNIFTLWDYPRGPPPLFGVLNVESWRRHSRQACGEPILISDVNVRAYIPDLPDEYFLVDHVAAKSDLVRYALLFHHGGMYLDADILVVQDLDVVIATLGDYDLVSYASSSSEHSTCDGDFSSNFIGGRKGSTFHQRVWEAQKALLTNHCPIEELKALKVCCFDRPPGQKCHVPWAYVGERVSHPLFTELRSGGIEVSSFCFRGESSFVPGQLGTVFRQHPGLDEGLAWWREHNVPRPLDRIMYHLFNAKLRWEDMKCGGLLNETSVIGSLYRRSFSTGGGLAEVPPGSPGAAAFYAAHPEFRCLEVATVCHTVPAPAVPARPLEQFLPEEPAGPSAAPPRTPHAVIGARGRRPKQKR